LQVSTVVSPAGSLSEEMNAPVGPDSRPKFRLVLYQLLNWSTLENGFIYLVQSMEDWSFFLLIPISRRKSTIQPAAMQNFAIKHTIQLDYM
jgi:hypothetical protein